MEPITTATNLINVNPRALDERLQVVTKNHLLIMCIVFGLVSSFLYSENRKTQKDFNDMQSRNFERIILISEKQTILQEQTNFIMNEIKTSTTTNGEKLNSIINQK